MQTSWPRQQHRGRSHYTPFLETPLLFSSSQLQQVPAQDPAFPSVPTKCSALCMPWHRSQAPRTTNKVASFVRKAPCFPQPLLWRGTRSYWSWPNPEAGLKPVGTITLRVHVTSPRGLHNGFVFARKYTRPFSGWVFSYFWQGCVICKRNFSFFAPQSQHSVSCEQNFLF